jgi:hypothetical protein
VSSCISRISSQDWMPSVALWDASELPAFMNSLIRYGIGVLDWDLRRAGGGSYRVYHFVKGRPNSI